jgi:hypothetical protein
MRGHGRSHGCQKKRRGLDKLKRTGFEMTLENLESGWLDY